VKVCPEHGALMNERRHDVGLRRKETGPSDVGSLCTARGMYADYHIMGHNRILHVRGAGRSGEPERLLREGPDYGVDYVHHKQRLTTRWIAQAGVPKKMDSPLIRNTARGSCGDWERRSSCSSRVARPSGRHGQKAARLA